VVRLASGATRRDKMGVTSAARYQSLYTVSKLLWSLKPVMGMLSDLLPVAHYHKRFYLLAAGACGSAACAVLAAAPVVKFGAGTTAAMLMFPHVDGGCCRYVLGGEGGELGLLSMGVCPWRSGARW